MRPLRLSVVTAAATVAALTAVTGCTEKSSAGADGAITVTATDTECEVSKKEFPAGHVELDIENKGSKVTEVYLLFPDDRVVTERENIGPGTKQKVTAEVKAGDYRIACKPGMKGDGIRQDVKATGGGKVAKRDPRLDAAVASYRKYVQGQADETVPLAKVFAEAVKDGDVEAAKKAYAPSRIGWERTEPVAESFGDIDPKVDLREDGLEEGQDLEKDWTGWHRLERSLWQDGKLTDRDSQLADQLVTDLEDWQKRVGKAEITPTSMANGAKELLDEVATGKVTGEEERYSHTDLVDFKANVEGAEESYELLKSVAAENDPELTKELDQQFAALNTLLDKYRKDRTGYDFVSYDKVGKAEQKELSDAVNALAEPLSQLAAAVVK
ncbi:iron uptake system protein EfeO [Streptomyces europaeiscabiei]|uniref:Peptidase M75 family protein n=1 Tax=Streptomyces europaeiscabiei TaxID=146819 RepID=A0ABU4NB97_9ACTN|nr:iron uptake system protein EfeO [Streptomyces europaeiscabiei]MDX2524136.1 peptidase M75 family protein [Streptomyces europaeiscabiei]MDX2763219.1 peptidase M75 family protein [Streptomyces europaeiscabiei]MDX2772975.1 peptidase M75 family protein [Streptomyces europaeiscabiei]MDX3545401.1 peptidase M75 family protein [Streptomyces europaeiscabiei]MDX3554392.1 peptidase M75 family protein [Streptomyces europaeiscabiei]